MHSCKHCGLHWRDGFSAAVSKQGGEERINKGGKDKGGKSGKKGGDKQVRFEGGEDWPPLALAAGAAPPGSIPGLGDMSEQDTVHLIELAKKAGNAGLVRQYELALAAIRPKPPEPPKARADRAHHEIQQLEKTLDEQLRSLDNLRDKVSAQQEKVAATQVALEEADKTYKQAIGELHELVDEGEDKGSAHQQPASINVADILDGKLTFSAGDGGVFGLAEYEDVDEEDVRAAKAREEQLAEAVKEVTGQLFGQVRERAEKLKAEHEAVKKRLAGKKRKTDTGAPEGSAAGGPSQGQASGGAGGAEAAAEAPKEEQAEGGNSDKPKVAGVASMGKDKGKEVGSPSRDVRERARVALTRGSAV